MLTTWFALLLFIWNILQYAFFAFCFLPRLIEQASLTILRAPITQALLLNVAFYAPIAESSALHHQAITNILNAL
jgi:hypothetical protein